MARIIFASLASVARIAWGAASTPLDFSFSQSDTWRLVNDAQVTYGWAIAELRVFSDACQSELSPRLEGSGMPGLPASRAQDGQVITEWRSGCHICEVGEASLSLHFDVEVNVMCLQLYQWGDRDFAATAVRLQRWGEEQAWVDVLRGTGMQGGQWDTLRFVQCAPLAPPNFGSVRLTNNGLFPSEATFTCKGIRPMTGSSTSVCGPDGEWSEGPPACWEAVHFIAAFSLVALLDAVAFVVYYRCFVMQRPAPLSEESMLPQDYLGQWNSDLIGGCTMEPQGALLATACFCCRIGETWQQAGFMAFQYAALIPHFFFCCLPCIGTYFRGLMRQRFSIRRHTTTLDCFAWTVLPCCASVQEAKMVDAMCVVAMEEARAKEAADKRKADADAQRIIEAVSSKKPTAFRYGLSTNTGALRKPKGALEMVSQA